MLAFLTLPTVLNFIDRQLIPTLAPKLIEGLGLSKAQIGLLYGFVFVILYTLFGLVLGTVADRYHRPRLIAGGLTLCFDFPQLMVRGLPPAALWWGGLTLRGERPRLLNSRARHAQHGVPLHLRGGPALP